MAARAREASADQDAASPATVLILAMVSMLPVLPVLPFAGLIVHEYQRGTHQYILQDLVDRTRAKSIEVERLLEATALALGGLAGRGSARIDQDGCRR